MLNGTAFFDRVKLGRAVGEGCRGGLSSGLSFQPDNPFLSNTNFLPIEMGNF